MLLPIPHWITTLFICTTLFTLIWAIFSLWKSPNPTTQKSANAIGLLLLMWCIFQSTLALNGWYMDRTSSPPHLGFALLLPSLIFIVAMALPFTRNLLSGLSLFHLTSIHIIRIPVELCLWQLHHHQQIPISMTFEGFNFDIIMGLTAIPMAILVYRGRANRSLLLGWNILGLVLLSVIVITAIGAAPTSIQWRDFSNPNFAVTHFPFIWLPSFVVPVVLFAHILSLVKMLRSTR